MPSLEYYGSLGNLKIDYTETIDKPNNASVITITAVYVMETGYYGRTIYPVGLIKVNGTTALSFNYAPGVYTSGTNQWVNVNAPAATPVSVPHGPDGRGSATIEIAAYSGYSYFHFFAAAGNYQTAITISPASTTIELEWIPQNPPTMSLAVVPVSDNQTVQSWGLPIQGYSRLLAKITAQAAPGLEIAEYRVEFGPDDVHTTAEATSEILYNAGRVEVSASVKDNAGLEAGAGAVVNVIPYAAPTANDIELFRCTASGTPSDTGAYFSIKAKLQYTYIAHRNVGMLWVRFRERGAASWSNWYSMDDNVARVIGGTLSQTKSYDVQLSAEDNLNETVYNLVVKTTSTGLNIMKEHRGAAFGKYAEKQNALELPPGWHFAIDGVNIEDILYPVGVVVWTASATLPAPLAALGTWEQVNTYPGETELYAFARTS